MGSQPPPASQRVVHIVRIVRIVAFNPNLGYLRYLGYLRLNLRLGTWNLEFETFTPILCARDTTLGACRL